MDLIELVLRLGVASLSGGLIGLERERHNRPAGLRTHMLVCVGSALVMIVSIAVARDYSPEGIADPGRIAAQVVSGIGFLGAGTIIRDGFGIRGLTTAATLWVAAAIGLAAGAGYHIHALIVTALTLVTLIALSRFEHVYLQAKNETIVQVLTVDQPSQLSRVAAVFGALDINIHHVAVEEGDERGHIQLSLTVRRPGKTSRARLTEALLSLENVTRVDYSDSGG